MRQKGFTLIELAVTLAVLAVLAALIVPSFRGWYDTARIRNVATSLQNGLQTARSEAMKRNQRVTFWLADPGNCQTSNASGSWMVSMQSPASNCTTVISDTTAPMLLAERPVGDSGGHVMVQALDSSGNAASGVTFDGFGRVVASDAGISSPNPNPPPVEPPIAQIAVTSANAAAIDSPGYRRLCVQVSSAGQVSLCDPSISDATDPHACAPAAPAPCAPVTATP